MCFVCRESEGERVKERKGRVGRNPRTGESVDIPTKRVPLFKAGKALKDAVK